MIGSDSIDTGLKKIWQSWFAFRKGKHLTNELNEFQYRLEKNLFSLFSDLNDGTYRHAGYRTFMVCDNKRREISVAPIRDRVVHRLVYDFLSKQYDRAFIFDAWSCRKGKGLLGAIERVQFFLNTYPRAFIWKADVKKFFDSVDHKKFIIILSQKIQDGKTLNLLRKIIGSYSVDKSGGGACGMPIGNLTSQIFANIYLNEFDRFVKHTLKPKAYARYGDDFIMVEPNLIKLKYIRMKSIKFLKSELGLSINNNCDRILKPRHGLKFLGVVISPHKKNLSKRNLRRIQQRLDLKNASSYFGLLKYHADGMIKREFQYRICQKLFEKCCF